MNREETLALFAKGKDAWKAWVAEMQSKRDAREHSGEWLSSSLDPMEGRNDATRHWLQETTVDFSESDLELECDFSGLIFPGPARFNKTNFTGRAGFEEATFFGVVEFEEAAFLGKADFAGARFLDGAYFEGATFLGHTEFARTKFAGPAIFARVTFQRAAGFGAVEFQYGNFNRATFSEYAYFAGVTFSNEALFSSATFSGGCYFESASFLDEANFRMVTFSGYTVFDEVTFSGKADFDQSTFGGSTSYEKAIFVHSSNFAAIHAERAFSLVNARFYELPDFVQAHFAEAPALDKVHFESGWHRMKARVRRLFLDDANTRAIYAAFKPGPWYRTKARVRRFFQGDRGASARYRALKRLAVQGHDNESEINFFAREITSARFVTDYPLVWRIWSVEAWSGVVRFWFGLFYQLTSSFGRSVFRPLLLWGLTAMLATGYFLGRNPDVMALRNAEIAAGASRGILTYARSSAAAWQKRQPCFAGLPDTNPKGEFLVSGLAEPVRRSTDAASEAMQLALRNALVFVDAGAESAHRTFGCLYGVERYAIVPSDVAFISALQKAVSGVLIFLFGLAVRNMLRMK